MRVLAQRWELWGARELPSGKREWFEIPLVEIHESKREALVRYVWRHSLDRESKVWRTVKNANGYWLLSLEIVAPGEPRPEPFEGWSEAP